MKKYALAAFSTLACIVAVQFQSAASPFHTNNIVLKNFQAIQAPVGAKVMWEFTTEEFDVDCTLEKSTDGVNFSPFRSMHLASTRQQAVHSYLDKDAMGQTFYRLRITKQSYVPFVSQIVSVNLQRQGANYVGQPQIGVSNENFFGELSAQDKVMCVRLVDMSGQAKIRQYVKGTDLERVFRPSFSHLPAGCYVLNINDAQNKTLMNKCIYKF